MPDHSYRPSPQDPLLIMAMDHRESFGRSLFGVKDDQPDEVQRAAMQSAKRLIYAGLAQARAQLPGGRAGVLVDERYGQAVIDAARTDGVVLAIPLERSGRDWFELEWGQDWQAHVTANRPDFAKVLVRDNPAFPADQRDQQLRALRAVSDALHGLDVPLLYELLVPATDEQRAAAGGAADAYDRDVRPGLVAQVIADNQAAGVEPAIWKVEGLETAEAARAVVAQMRAGGRDHVCAIVLGRDAPAARLDHWLEVAAPVDGFVGFAIGRSIWEDPIAAHNEGKADEDETVSQIAERYLGFARQYWAARAEHGLRRAGELAQGGFGGAAVRSCADRHNDHISTNQRPPTAADKVPLRQVRALFTSHTITVYQAYSAEIADRAVAAGTFVPPFKLGRMTWIKPSFLWMMYRSGWATKPGQERILAIRITREGFEWALAHAALSHYDPAIHRDYDHWLAHKQHSPVRVQWDPERSITLTPLSHRAIQVGLSGEAIHRYVDDWVTSITDVTDTAVHIHQHVTARDLDAAQAALPAERHYPLPGDLRATVGAS